MNNFLSSKQKLAFFLKLCDWGFFSLTQIPQNLHQHFKHQREIHLQQWVVHQNYHYWFYTLVPFLFYLVFRSYFRVFLLRNTRGKRRESFFGSQWRNSSQYGSWNVLQRLRNQFLLFSFLLFNQIQHFRVFHSIIGFNYFCFVHFFTEW